MLIQAFSRMVLNESIIHSQVTTEGLAAAEVFLQDNPGWTKRTGTYVGCMFVDYMSLLQRSYGHASTGTVMTGTSPFIGVIRRPTHVRYTKPIWKDSKCSIICQSHTEGATSGEARPFAHCSTQSCQHLSSSSPRESPARGLQATAHRIRAAGWPIPLGCRAPAWALTLPARPPWSRPTAPTKVSKPLSCLFSA